MPKARTRRFGPLFYSTVLIAAVSTLYVKAGPKVSEWRERYLLNAGIRSSNPSEFSAAKRAITQLGPRKALPYWVNIARDARPELRALACESVVQSGVLQDDADLNMTMRILTEAAADRNEEVRLEAVQALGRFPAFAAAQIRPSALQDVLPPLLRQGREVLQTLIKDQPDLIRAAALDSLGAFGRDPGSEPLLMAAIAEADREIVLAASRSLLKINGPADRRATRSLIKLAVEPEPIPDRLGILTDLMGTDEETRTEVIAKLTKMLSQSRPLIVVDVIDCLKQLGRRSSVSIAVPVLEDLWNGRKGVIRVSAGMALVSLLDQQSSRAVEVLSELTADPTLSLDSRMAALEDLVAKRNPPALAKIASVLIRQLGDANITTRQDAIALLNEIIGSTPVVLSDTIPKQN